MPNRTNAGDDTSVAGSILRWVDQAARNLYYLSFRACLYFRCAFRRAFEIAFIHSCDVVPPPLLRYKVSESTDIRLFFDVGQRIAATIERALDDVGAPMGQMERVLDFGCGCGRTLAWLISRYPSVQFYGTDIDSASIQWCCEHLRGYFSTNQEVPPLRFSDAEFDCIYAISVFTHIDEKYQIEWLVELRRILRPGGLLLVSVHGVGTTKTLGAEERTSLQARGLLFKRSSKHRGIHPDFYHTTFHTKEYVMRRWSAFFEIVDYKELGLGYQDLVVLRRDGSLSTLPVTGEEGESQEGTGKIRA